MKKEKAKAVIATGITAATGNAIGLGTKVVAEGVSNVAEDAISSAIEAMLDDTDAIEARVEPEDEPVTEYEATAIVEADEPVATIADEPVAAVADDEPVAPEPVAEEVADAVAEIEDVVVADASMAIVEDEDDEMIGEELKPLDIDLDFLPLEIADPQAMDDIASQIDDSDYCNNANVSDFIS